MVVHNERTELFNRINCAREETTTDFYSLQTMYVDRALKFPVIAANDAYTKYLFDT